MVDAYEALKCDARGKPEYLPTAAVLAHFGREINSIRGGVWAKDGAINAEGAALRYFRAPTCSGP